MSWRGYEAAGACNSLTCQESFAVRGGDNYTSSPVTSTRPPPSIAARKFSKWTSATAGPLFLYSNTPATKQDDTGRNGRQLKPQILDSSDQDTSSWIQTSRHVWATTSLFSILPSDITRTTMIIFIYGSCMHLSDSHFLC